MRQDFVLFESRFNNRIIDRLMTIAQSVEWERGIENEHSKSMRAKVSSAHPAMLEITPILMLEMRSANVQFGFDVDYLQYVQFAKYTPELGWLDFHMDTFDNLSSLDERKISMTLQLSDPLEYDGGDLVLRNRFDRPGPDPFALRAKGSMLFFPSTTPHSVTQITRGVRYSLAAWFHGPYWR